MKLLKMNDVKEQGTVLKATVYGEPGSGKTWFGASASLDEKTAPCLFLEYRAQIGSLRSNAEYLEAIEDGRLIILSIDAYKDLSYIHHWLKGGRGSQKDLDGLMESLGWDNDVMPKTVVLDSLTELQRSEVLRIAGNDESGLLTNVESPKINHWGDLLNQFTNLAHRFFLLPYHIVFSGLEKADFGSGPVGESPPIEGYRIALQGQAQRQFPAYAYLVMRLERSASSSHYNIGYTQAVKSKTKQQYGPNIPPRIPDPSIPMLVRLLEKE